MKYIEIDGVLWPAPWHRGYTILEELFTIFVAAVLATIMTWQAFQYRRRRK